jgi:hypothetical protein
VSDGDLALGLTVTEIRRPMREHHNTEGDKAIKGGENLDRSSAALFLHQLEELLVRL